jgi:hypothetical protein
MTAANNVMHTSGLTAVSRLPAGSCPYASREQQSSTEKITNTAFVSIAIVMSQSNKYLTGPIQLEKSSTPTAIVSFACLSSYS